MNMQEEEIHLRDYWRILSKRRSVFLSFFCVVVGIVLVYSFAATPVFKGTAQVLFNLDNNQTLNFAEGGGAAIIQTKNPAEYLKPRKRLSPADPLPTGWSENYSLIKIPISWN